MSTIEREERCPWNPFPIDSEWGRALDRNYRRRFKRSAGDEMVQATAADVQPVCDQPGEEDASWKK